MTPPSLPYLLKLYRKNDESQGPGWSLGVYASGSKLLFDGTDAGLLSSGGTLPWQYERCELYAAEQPSSAAGGPSPTFTIPTLATEPKGQASISFDNSIQILRLKFHMLMLNGDQHQHDQYDVTAIGIQMKLYRAPGVVNGTKQYVTFLGGGENGNIGSTPWSWKSAPVIPPVGDEKKADFPVSQIDGEWFAQKRPIQALGVTCGPLLANAFQGVSKIDAGASLEIVLLPADLASAIPATLALFFRPGPKCSPFPLPVDKTGSRFRLPVLPDMSDAGEVADCRYRFVQRPSDRWLKRQSIEGPQGEEWLLSLETAGLENLWNQALDQYDRALRTVRPVNRTTLLPCVENHPTIVDPKPCFPQHDDERDFNLCGQFLVRRKPKSGGPLATLNDLTIEEFRIKPLGTLDAILCFDFGERGLTNPSAAHHRSRALFYRAKVTRWSLNAEGGETQDLYSFAWEAQLTQRVNAMGNQDLGTGPGEQVRIGSLDLSFGGVLPDQSSTTKLQYIELSGNSHRVPRLIGDITLPILDASPGGQDGLPASEYVPEGYSSTPLSDELCMDRRFTGSQPIVIPISNNPGAAATSFLLQIHESNPQIYSETVSLILRRVSTPPLRDGHEAPIENPRVVVIDSDPFLIAEVEYSPLVALNSDVVALWSTGNMDGEAWQLRSEAQPFSLILPPQGVGEEMPKACELWDKDGGTPVGGKLGCGEQSPNDDNKLKPLDFRFSPPARQELLASYTPQNFTEAPWNLRRILGYPGQRDAGAGVKTLSYELLYGLSCSTEAPLLRLAEVFSLIGRIPGRIAAYDPPSQPAPILPIATQSKLFLTRRWNWSLYAELYSKHLALLESRASGSNYGTTLGAAGASDPPEVFTISQGVSCQFRKSADLYYSVDPAVLAHADADAFPEPTSTGLRGGVTWPFESPRIFRATVRNPKSSSALASGLALSALGGSGTIKAGFDKDLSTVTSVTEFGRASKVSVARLGRIGVFHNLARYVIEYERDASVSKQFEDKQTPFKNRPVLRKVREYVEILEPIATLSNAQQLYPGGGCAKSIEFKQRVIPVSGTWSSNVGDGGWKVPLWFEPDSHTSATNIYKYDLPSVVFNLAGKDGSDVECSIRTVDKLFFYTETDANADSDPHNWPIVPGVDFLPVPPPASNPAFSSGTAHEIPAYDSPVPFGLAAFTHELEAGHGPANIVYGRSTQAIGADLTALTLQRAPQTPSDVQKQLQAVHDKIRTDLFNAVRLDPSGVPGLAQNLCDSAEALVAPIKTQLDALAKTVATKETSFLQRYLNQAAAEVGILGDDLKAQLRAQADLLHKNIASVESQLEDTVNLEVQGLLHRLTGIPTTVNALQNFFARVCQVLVSAKVQLDTIKDSLKQSLHNVSLTTSQEAAQIQQSVEDTRALLVEPLARARNFLSSLRSQVQSSAEPWMPGAAFISQQWEGPICSRLAKVESVLAQGDTLLSYANSGALDQIGQAQSAFHAVLNDAIQSIDGVSFPSGLLNAADQAQKDAAAVRVYFNGLPDQVQKQFHGWIGLAANSLQNGVIQTQADLDAIASVLTQQILGFFDIGSAGLQALQNSVLTLASTVANQLVGYANNLSQEFCDGVKHLQDAAISQLNSQLEALRRAVEDAAGRLAESIARALPPIDIQLPPGASLPVLLNRAFGSVPSIPNLGFSLPNAAYFFGQIAPGQLVPNVNLTPLLTQVKDLVPNLSPLSTLVPSFALSDRALPVPHLPSFDLNSVLPDFAGLKLTNLFPALKMPEGSSDAVKITHGIDNSSRTAWVQADIDLKTDTASIFSVGPMALQIRTPHFTSRVRAQANSTGQISKEATGAITGDWQLLIGGAPMITFVSTALTFDKDGKLHVDVSPERVQLSAALSFVQQVIALYSSPDSGFGIYPSATGIETRLALPIPDTSLGTTGITNLTFNFLFGLSWVDNFRLYAGFGLASPDRPFNISVFILGGGGHLVAQADFTPGQSLVCTVDMAMDASAALSIAFGPISGSVHVNLGMRFIFNSGSGDLSLGVFLLIGGEVSILGIVSASILLRLDATYENGTFTCRGLFSISIKICWCFTLNVSEEVSCHLGSGGGVASYRKPTLPWEQEPDSDFFLPASAISSVPAKSELDLYTDFADRYLQLVS